jgi:hypothetical protein
VGEGDSVKQLEIEVKISIARREMEYWQGILSRKSCKNCEFYSMPECMKHEANPPPDVVPVGCDDYEYDGVPF